MNCKCKYECKSFTHGQKVILFQQFYEMQDNAKQNSYLMGLLNVCPVKRRRHGGYETPDASRRQATVYFTLPNGTGNVVQVCKQTFLQIFGISRRRVETLVKTKKAGHVNYIERRGNKTLHRKYSIEDETLVVEHISRFPREKSHYGRMKSSKEYLSQDLNINRLYRSFKDTYPNSNISYRYYYTTFNNKFPDLKFHHPRTDTCQTCDLLTMQSKCSPNDKSAKHKLELHHRKAERAMKAMKEDHARSQLPLSDICTISIDLQQVLSLPALTHSQMYYLRQLSCYNFGIHIADTNKGHMHLWHEGISGRGGNEIASCIWKNVTGGMTGKNKLIIWSDNCAGQNKNKMMLFLCILMVTKGYFQEVNLKFLVSGHSFLSCDRDFAQIEKRKRLEKCEVPIDLVRLMTSATPNNPFIVTLMQPEDFIDFKAAADSTLNTTKLQISKAAWIQISAAHPGSVTIKETLNEMEPWKSVNVFKKNVKLQNIKNMSLPQLDCVNRITAEKKTNIQAIIPFMKEKNREFYRKLLA